MRQRLYSIPGNGAAGFLLKIEHPHTDLFPTVALQSIISTECLHRGGRSFLRQEILGARDAAKNVKFTRTAGVRLSANYEIRGECDKKQKDLTQLI
mgnify:FL=1